MKWRATACSTAAHVLCCVMAVIICSGCGLTIKQKAATQTFGSATATLGGLATQEFTQDRADVIAMNQSRRLLGDSTVSNVDGNYSLERVKTRVDAVTALKTYGELLACLVTNSQTAQIKSAASTFTTNLGALEGINFTKQQSDAVNQAVQTLGGLFVEYKRKKVLESIIQGTHTNIGALVDKIAISFDTNQVFWSLEYDTTLSALRGQIAIVQTTGKLASNDLASRAVLQSSLNLTDADEQRFRTASMNILKTCASLKSAEKSLVVLLKNDNASVEDIQAYAKSIQDFVTLYTVMSK